MAVDRDTRSGSYFQTATWTELLSTFQVALDPKKLLLAAAGILSMSFGWWLLSVIFYASTPQPLESNYAADAYQRIYDKLPPEQVEAKRKQDFQRDLERWELLDRLAGPNGKLRTMPWYEDRGPNPFLFGTRVLNGTPVERRDNISWFLTNQVPVLVEPLVKFLAPVIGLLDPKASFGTRFYLFLCLLWMLVVWAFFGGVITRLAIVQLANKDQVNFKDTLKFVGSRYFSYLSSPLVPLGLIAAVVLGCILFGIVFMIPIVGDLFIAGIGWPLILGAGIVMTILLVGLVGYPLMYTTLSAEGSDTFDALSRSYNYVYQSPWSYLWYGFIAVIYGAVLIFFVVFMSSMMVYLGKWSVAQTPFIQSANVAPDYLFVYSPTSFGWRELLLSGSDVAIEPTLGISDGRAIPAIAAGDVVTPNVAGYRFRHPEQAKAYLDSFTWHNHVGAFLVSTWVTIIFVLMLGFTYSYFWTASAMIYLLMRKKVDETEIDEIYTEDEDLDAAPAAPPRTAPNTPSVTMIDPPTLRTPPAPPVMTTPPITPPPPPVMPPVTPPVTPPPPPVMPSVTPPPPPVMPPVTPPVTPPTPPVTPPPTPPVTPPVTPPPPPVMPPVTPPVTPPTPPVTPPPEDDAEPDDSTKTD